MTVRLCTCFWGDFKLYFFHSQVHMYTNMLINIWMTAPCLYLCMCRKQPQTKGAPWSHLNRRWSGPRHLTSMSHSSDDCWDRDAWGHSSSDYCRSELNCQCCSEGIISLDFLSIWASLCYHISQIVNRQQEAPSATATSCVYVSVRLRGDEGMWRM